MGIQGLGQLVIVERAPIIRTGLCHSIKESGYLDVTTAASVEAVKLSLPGEPRLVVIGPSFADDEALGQCREAKIMWSCAKLILLTYHANEFLFQTDAVMSGASGCLSPDCQLAELAQAIAISLAGYQLFSRDSLLASLQPPRITAREREVLQSLAAGMTDKAIAVALGLTFQTVRNHVQRILEKLEVHDRRRAIQRARRLGWL